MTRSPRGVGGRLPAAVAAAAVVIAAVAGARLVVPGVGVGSDPAVTSPAPTVPATPPHGSAAVGLMTPDLTGWHHTGAGGFVVEEVGGELVYRTRGGMGLLWLDRVLTDFTLRLELQVEGRRANSGIFVRIPDRPETDEYVSRAFEVQIDTGGTGHSATGAVYGIQPPFTPVPLEPGTWHEVVVRAHGPQLDVVIDGVLVNAFQARRDGPVVDYAPAGYLGLQNHGPTDVVRFRRIELLLPAGPG